MGCTAVLVAVELAYELQHVGKAGEEVGGQRRDAEVEAVGRLPRGNGVARGAGNENQQQDLAQPHCENEWVCDVVDAVGGV
jgi:hypothetical protein